MSGALITATLAATEVTEVTEVDDGDHTYQVQARPITGARTET